MLLAAAAVLLALQLVIPRDTAVAARLFALGVLGGFANALTDANDRRITFGRRAFSEPVSLGPTDLLAVGGAVGVVLTWAALPVVYFLAVGPRLNYGASGATFRSDIGAALTTPLRIGNVTLPWGWLWTGAITVLYTACVLKVLSTEYGRNYGAFLPIVFIADLMAGVLLFNEHLERLELLAIIPMVIVLTALMFHLRPRSHTGNTAQSAAGRRVAVPFCAALAGAVAVDAATRSSLERFEPTRRAMISLAFRAAFFSVFSIWVLYWLIARTIARRKGRVTTTITRKASGLAAVTGALFTATYFLKIPAVGQTLAVGPLAFNSASAIAYPLVCAMYGTDANSATMTGRIRQAFLSDESRQWRRSRFLWSYLAMAFVLAWWCSIKLAA